MMKINLMHGGGGPTGFQPSEIQLFIVFGVLKTHLHSATVPITPLPTILIPTAYNFCMSDATAGVVHIIVIRQALAAIGRVFALHQRVPFQLAFPVTELRDLF
jgi:hypothetical protein